jgi:glycosyltransferase involved in cell wall biosynthesis
MENLCNKKILFVFSRMELGGAERQGLMLARHLKEQCGAIMGVAGLHGEPGMLSRLCEGAGIHCHPLRLCPMRTKGECMLALVKFALWLRRERPELIVSYTRNANVLSGLAWRLCGARGFVWNQADEGLNLSGELASRLAVCRTPLFVSNSSGGAQFLRERYGVPNHKIKIIHNGIALAPPAMNSRECRDRIGLRDDEFAVCMVANISRFKDHDTLLAAWRQVLTLVDPVSPVLLLAGRCDRPEGEVACLLHGLDLGDRVRLLGAVDDVYGVLSASDLFVYSSRSEGLPNAVVEAMSVGLPVAGTDIPGIREAVGPSGTRFLAPPGDPAGLAHRIVQLMSDPHLRKVYGEELRVRAAKEFSLKRMLTCSAECIAALLKGSDR